MEDFGSALEKNVADLTVMDVYDIAAVVGQEFERIIDQYGCEALSRLMPKVVRVLEILEVMVSRNSISPETEELRLELDKLRLERMDRMEKEKKHKKELELVEDVWRGEAQDLLTQIAQLQEENQSLLSNRSIKDPLSEEDLQRHEGMTERERQVMKKLKEVVDKQRDEIRAKDRELTLKNEDVEALQQQQNRLMKINHDLRHKISVVEAQGKALIEQKVELEAGAQARGQEVGALRQEVTRLRERLQGVAPGAEAEEERPPLSPTQGEEEAAGLDQKDPNRPRFTLQELRDVLHERNELKAKVFLLQEELAYYKSEEADDEVMTSSPSPSPEPRGRGRSTPQPESGIKRLIFTAIMPMVAAGLIPDDPTLQPIRRLMSLVRPCPLVGLHVSRFSPLMTCVAACLSVLGLDYFSLSLPLYSDWLIVGDFYNQARGIGQSEYT
uniref:RILP-like protein 1 n=1 Tax=Gadus morhua TaxID=8049 RepID=A0A8C4ZR62_GADMO